MKKLVLVMLSLMMICALVDCSMEEPAPELTDVEKFAEKDEISVEKFAEENGISVELAQSIEDTLSQTTVPASLNTLKGWKQSADYVDGQRYTGWVYSNLQDQYYYMVFYVQGDKVVSIRDQQNGLEYLYQSEE